MTSSRGKRRTITGLPWWEAVLVIGGASVSVLAFIVLLTKAFPT